MPFARSPRRHYCFGLTLACIPALLLTALLAPMAPRALAQANTASISISKSFVTPTGQAAQPPGGSAAGVSFSFTPASGGQPATVLTTNASGQAFGALSAGSYTFQESAPAPGTTLLSASISQSGGPGQNLVPGVPIPFSPGGMYSITATDQITGQGSGAGSATVTVYTSLTTGSTQPAVGSLAGYSYTLGGQAGLPSQTLITNQLGQAAFTAVPAGVYSVSETPVAGSTFSSMLINGVPAQQQQPFQVQAGGNYEVDVTNSVSGAGNLSIQIQFVDQNGQVIPGNGAGLSFTLTPQNASAAPTTTTTSSSGIATANLAPGAYSIAETSTPGSTLLTYSINGVSTQTGQFTVGLGQNTTITAVNRSTGTALTGAAPSGFGGRVTNLQSGCNNAVSTFPDGTSGTVVAAAVSPSSVVVSIWKFDNLSQAYHSVYFAPTGNGAQAPADLPGLSRLDPFFLCVTAPATLSEPAA